MFPVESVKVSITFVMGLIIEMNRVSPPKYQDRQTDRKKRQKRKKKSWQNKLVQSTMCVRGTVLFFSCTL